MNQTGFPQASLAVTIVNRKFELASHIINLTVNVSIYQMHTILIIE
jgi:hypothetical protein